ncbi:MAG: hypothetical protein DRP83_00310 [Planctomycetota bacterium]|nr:MAG: hypothetical protein DRP83_00310 [Planctomycetota bacterium]
MTVKMKQLTCLFEGCDGIQGPEAVEIHHQGELVGYICDNCQRGPKGFKLTLHKENGKFVPVQAVPLNSIRE